MTKPKDVAAADWLAGARQIALARVDADPRAAIQSFHYALRSHPAFVTTTTRRFNAFMNGQLTVARAKQFIEDYQ